MRLYKLLLFVLGFLFIAHDVGAKLSPQKTFQNVIDSFSINGINYKSTLEDFFKTLKENDYVNSGSFFYASPYKENQHGYFTSYKLKNGHIFFSPWGLNEIVCQTSCQFSHGVKLGDSKEKILETLGPPPSGDEPQQLTYHPGVDFSHQLVFHFDSKNKLFRVVLLPVDSYSDTFDPSHYPIYSESLKKLEKKIDNPDSRFFVLDCLPLNGSSLTKFRVALEEKSNETSQLHLLTKEFSTDGFEFKALSLERGKNDSSVLNLSFEFRNQSYNLKLGEMTLPKLRYSEQSFISADKLYFSKTPEGNSYNPLSCSLYPVEKVQELAGYFLNHVVGYTNP